ncbi:tetratricopeptide repeat protein [Wukongibacter baidiensis]
MFTNKIRIILIISGLVIGSFFIFIGDIFNGIILIAVSLLLIYGYFRYGAIYLAFQYVVRDNLVKAKELIDTTPTPNLLNKQHKGFYFFINGIIKFNEKDWKSAESDFIEALNYNLRTENNKSIIYGHLAQIYMKKRDFGRAKAFLEKAEEIPHKKGVDERINRIKKQIKELDT